MKVFKFGGASVKNAGGVKNVAAILNRYPGEKIIVVVSAMGKTTNALEKLVDKYAARQNITEDLAAIKDYHFDLAGTLFTNRKSPVFSEVSAVFSSIEAYTKKVPSADYDFDYDQIVCMGEILSTKILSAYLREAGIDNQWFDARSLIKTDDNYRDAKVDWQLTQVMTDKSLLPFMSRTGGKRAVAVTQGFIGQTKTGHSVTLGRDGSDYTTAILAYTCNAEEVIIWKDVAGVLNADPKWFDETIKLDRLSYHDAIELAYYGATVIHPKTIKPLQNKQISLWVKSFAAPDEPGTIIKDDESVLAVPSFIFKIDQALITISPKDFSFIVEENLRDIFHLFTELKVKINVMQNSALRFSVCVDYDSRKVPTLIDKLKENFIIRYNTGLELITIRHYDQTTIDRVCVNKNILLEQKSRSTVQLVVKPSD